MHAAHQSFYNRYVNLIEKELRVTNSKCIYSIIIQPKNIIPLCCELPMWAILCKNTKDKIYMIFPSKIYNYYNKHVEKLEAAIHKKDSIEITVLSDPETEIKCFLYTN